MQTLPTQITPTQHSSWTMERAASSKLGHHPGIVKTGIEDGGTVCSHYRTFERIQGDPRGVSDGPKRDMCSRVELIFKNYPDLYVPINPIFFPKLDGMN